MKGKVNAVDIDPGDQSGLNPVLVLSDKMAKKHVDSKKRGKCQEC